MKRLPHVAPLLVLLLVGGVALLLRGPFFASATLSNLGWAGLNDQLVRRPEAGGVWDDYQRLFSEALSLDNANNSAWFGKGLTHGLRGEIEPAIQAWIASGVDSATLNAYGLSGRENGNLDIALAQFRAADALDNPTGDLNSYFLAGTICQRVLSNQEALSPNNRDYCSAYWQINDDNLIVNSGFESKSAIGWNGAYNFGPGTQARLSVESGATPDEFAVRMTGLDDSNHLGLFQRLSLSPGDRVRFSGRFRMAGEKDLRARLLFVGWRDGEGVEQGNHAELREGSLEWTTFARELTIPENSQGEFDFYPVIVSGVGDVWFDDIRLQRIR